MSGRLTFDPSQASLISESSNYTLASHGNNLSQPAIPGDLNRPVGLESGKGGSTDLSKPFLRYIRVRCKDVEMTITYYTKVLLMKVLDRIETPGTTYLYMSNVDDDFGDDDGSSPTPHLVIRFEYDKRKEAEHEQKLKSDTANKSDLLGQTDSATSLPGVINTVNPGHGNSRRNVLYDEPTKDDVFFVYYVKHIMPFIQRLKDNNFPIWIQPQEFYRAARIAQVYDPNGLKLRLIQLPEEAMKSSREIKLKWTVRLAYISVRCADVVETTQFYEQLFSAAANVFIPSSFISRKRGAFKKNAKQSSSYDDPDFKPGSQEISRTGSEVEGLTQSPSHSKLGVGALSDHPGMLSEQPSQYQSQWGSATTSRVQSPHGSERLGAGRSTTQIHSAVNAEDGLGSDDDNATPRKTRKEGEHAFLNLRTGFRVVDQETFSHNRSSYVWLGHGDRSTFPCICFVEFFDVKTVPPPSDFLGLGFSVASPEQCAETFETTRPNMEIFYPDTSLELRGHGQLFRFPDNNDLPLEISRYGDPSYDLDVKRMEAITTRLEGLSHSNFPHDDVNPQSRTHEFVTNLQGLDRDITRSPSWSKPPTNVRRANSELGEGMRQQLRSASKGPHDTELSRAPVPQGRHSMKDLMKGSNTMRTTSPLSQASRNSSDQLNTAEPSQGLASHAASYVFSETSNESSRAATPPSTDKGSTAGDTTLASPSRVTKQTSRRSVVVGHGSDSSLVQGYGVKRATSFHPGDKAHVQSDKEHSLPELDDPASLFATEHRSAKQLRKGMFSLSDGPTRDLRDDEDPHSDSDDSVDDEALFNAITQQDQRHGGDGTHYMASQGSSSTLGDYNAVNLSRKPQSFSAADLGGRDKKS